MDLTGVDRNITWRELEQLHEIQGRIPDSEQNPGSWRDNNHSNVTVGQNDIRTPEINKRKEQSTCVSKFYTVRREEYANSSTLSVQFLTICY